MQVAFVNLVNRAVFVIKCVNKFVPLVLLVCKNHGSDESYFGVQAIFDLLGLYFTATRGEDSSDNDRRW